jgi:hypothetical protein
MSTGWALAIFFAGFLGFLALLSWSDGQCAANGDVLVVVTEHQAKGDMKHTECRK